MKNMIYLQEMPVKDLISIIAIIIAVASFLAGQFRTKSSSVLEGRIIILETRWELFSKIIEKEIGNMLHSPHRAALDKLIDKNNSGEQLSTEEAKEFVYLLQELENKGDIKNESERFGITLLKAAIASRYRLEGILT